jgi:hypothetical protein
MAVTLENIAERAPIDAERAIYRINRHETMILRKEEGEWKRTGKIETSDAQFLIKGMNAEGVGLWDIDAERFVAGTQEQKDFIPEPKVLKVEEVPKREPKNRHLIERNWLMWRMRNEQGVTFAQIAREFNITSSRVRDIVICCDRRVRNAILFKNDPEGFDRRGIRDALMGVEIVCRQGETPYLMFENERRLDFY